jgi:N-hydroxyarylamine O-acetyltransferase
MNVQKYLLRIGINSIDLPSLVQLTILQQQHLLYIPFENLNIHLGKKISLDYEAIFEKVINQRRGGFCYELNGLFFLLLKKLGYKVKRISARVNGSSGNIGKEYDHLAIIVTIENQDWLVDVGFGKFSFQPLKILLDEEQKDERGEYKILRSDEAYYAVYTKEKNQDWLLGYLFTLDHRRNSEFEKMCQYHQTSEESNFTKRRLCTIPTKEGRVTLTDTKLKIEKNGEVMETEVDSEEVFRAHLKNYFDMELEY